MKTTRVVLSALVAAALFTGYFASARAQYARHALIEEGTGNWCGYCPYGAFTIDSMVARMGENLVVISWHGPSGDNEPLYLIGAHPTGYQAIDTLDSYDSITGFPWASIGRDEVGASFSGAYEHGGILDWPQNPWYTTAEKQAIQAPIIDFRVVNAVYSGSAVDFDLDITPLDMTQMPTEDTSKYVTVAVLTEDGPQTDQHIYDQSYTDIDPFVNENVAREVGGKVMGDVFVLKTAKSWPIRKHYHMAASNPDWNPDSLRVKAFAAVQWSTTKVGTKTIQSIGESYLDAGQTTYITTLPATAPNAVWTVLPVAGASYDGDSTEIPIVWSKGGSVTAAKLEYSTDGKTWDSIISATSVSPFKWQLPPGAYGQNNVTIRVSDASDASTSFTGPAFSIGPKPVATITVTSPTANDSLLVGTTQPITISLEGPVNKSEITIDLSTDGMLSWNPIAKIVNVTSNDTTYNWTVPTNISNTSTAVVRVTDANDSVGLSPIFAIVDTGFVSNVTVGDGASILALDSQTTVHWTVTGYLGDSVNVDYLVGGTVIGPVSDGDSAGTTSAIWLPDFSNPTSGITVRVTYASGATGTSAPFSIGAVNSVAPDASVESLMLSPNPFSGLTTLEFGLADAANVTLSIHDLLGREVMRMDEGSFAAGDHSITIDGSTLLSGSYEYTLIAGQKNYVGKLTVLR